MKAYEAIVDALVVEGVEDVFGLMGDGNMLPMAEMMRREELSVIDVRHEGTALTMAVGAAAISGNVAVCTVTCGPGLTQLGTALVDAVRAHAQVLVLAGDLAPTDRHINQWFPQSAFVASTGAAYLRVDDLDHLPDVLAQAFFTIRAEHRPVVLGVPMSLQDDEYGWDWTYRRAPAPATRSIPPSAAEVSVVCDLISKARRPVVIAGEGAVRSGMREMIVELCDRIGALAATTLRAKGFFGSYPFAAGIAGAFSTATTRVLFAEADLVVALGASVNYYTTEGGYLFGDAKIISIDSGPPRLRTEVDLELLVCADLESALPVVLKTIAGAPAVSGGFHTDDVRSRITGQQPAELAQAVSGHPQDLHPVTVVQHVDAVMPDDANLVVGVGHFWSFPIMYAAAEPGRFRVSYDFGSIGQAVPTAIGMARASHRPTVVFEGDGSLLMHVQELETLHRHPLPVLVIVMNDGNYGAEFHKLKAHDLVAADAAFGRPDFARIAQAFGIRGRAVEQLDDVARWVAEFSADQEPTVIDVPIDPSIVSAPYLRSVFGQDA